MQSTDSKYHSVDLLSHSHCHSGRNSQIWECRDCALSVCLRQHSCSLMPHLQANSRSWRTRLQSYLYTCWKRFCSPNEESGVAVKIETLHVCAAAKVLNFLGSIQWVFNGFQRRAHVSFSHCRKYVYYTCTYLLYTHKHACVPGITTCNGWIHAHMLPNTATTWSTR